MSTQKKSPASDNARTLPFPSQSLEVTSSGKYFETVKKDDTVHGSEIRRSPVELGSV